MLKRLEERERPLPEGYLNRPLLRAEAEFLWQAFWELTTERPIGFGAEGRIPHSRIYEFACRCSYDDPDTFAWFLALIREMDAEYLKVRAPKPPGSKLQDEVQMNDPAGIRAILRRNAEAREKPKAEEPAAAEPPP